ncbi:MAG: VOC family protein, partial [Trueperaceae bacterium]
MNPRINFITLASADMGAARKFYVEGLGWQPVFEAPGAVIFLQVSPTLILSLWSQEGFEEEIGAPMTGPGHPPFTLAHNVPSPEEVDAVMAAATAAGATLLKPALQRDWGGYSGYFADPNGFVWEVAYNPGPVGELLMEAEAAATAPSAVEVIRTRRSVGQLLLKDGPELDHAEVVAAVESAR